VTVIALAGVETALQTQLYTVSGLPTTRYVGTASIAPAPSVAYVETEFVPATTTAITMGMDGEVAREGGYFVRLYSATGGASTLAALADAVLAAFERGTALLTAGSDVVRIKGRPAPKRGGLIATTAGRSAVLVEIYWFVQTAD
jgi:hypothetical protein